MTKKDIIIFLHIYITNLKKEVCRQKIDIFREDVYRSLKCSVNFSSFIDNFRSLSLCNDCSIYTLSKNFIDYLYRVKKIVY